MYVFETRGGIYPYAVLFKWEDISSDDVSCSHELDIIKAVGEALEATYGARARRVSDLNSPFVTGTEARGYIVRFRRKADRTKFVLALTA